MRLRLSHARARLLLLVATGAIAVGIAAGAHAYWSGDGDGAAATVLGSPQQLTLSPGVAQAQLSPGQDSGVAVIATNANPYFVEVGSLILDTAAGNDGFDVDGDHSGCDTSTLTLAPQSNGGAGWRVPPRVATVDGALTIALDSALSMGESAASACQGASFTVHLIASD